MKRYKIGDFARELNVSNSFLKYYEQQGILRPSPAESGYRYYDFREAANLIAGIKYRNLGFSLKEAASILTSASLEDITQELTGKTEGYRLQMSHLNGLLEYVESIQDYCKMIRKKDCWSLTNDENFYFLPHSTQRAFIQTDAIRALVNIWLPEVPIVCSARKVFMGADGYPKPTAEGDPMFSWGFMGNAAFVESRLPTDPPIEKVYFERCMKYYYRQLSLYGNREEKKEYPSMTEEIDNVIKPVLSVINRHNFKLCGDIYMNHVMTTQEGGKRFDHFILYAPVT